MVSKAQSNCSLAHRGDVKNNMVYLGIFVLLLAMVTGEFDYVYVSLGILLFSLIFDL